MLGIARISRRHRLEPLAAQGARCGSRVFPRPVGPQYGLDVVSLDGALTGRHSAPPLQRSGHVVLELRHVVAPEKQPLLTLVETCAHSNPSVSVVCVNRSGRRLLREWGVEKLAPVFSTVADAVQALVLESQGYGCGWAPLEETAGAPGLEIEGITFGGRATSELHHQTAASSLA